MIRRDQPPRRAGATKAAKSPKGRRRIRMALAGNPNSGKTTIFNAMTGARQHVGNYPGVTVEKKEGTARIDDDQVYVVDLPGTYSLTAYTIEEIIARNVLLDEGPDVVVDIIDSANLERNLYLATQLLELGIPMVLAFNMADVAKARGFNINTDQLSGLLGVPIVTTVGHKGRGVRDLVAAAVETAHHGAEAVARQRHPDYGTEIEPHVRQLTDLIIGACGLKQRARWFAVKLLENDQETIKRLGALCGDQAAAILDCAAELRGHIEQICGDSAEIILADRRYGFISGACTEAVERSVETRHDISDKIDVVLTNRWLGLPLFLGMMYLVFQLTFTLGNPCVDFLDGLINTDFAGALSRLWPRDSDSLLRSLILDGIIAGVGAVLVFLPLILLLFLAIAFLEDSGYMARAAFIMDRVMHKLGLHGKSFIPMLIGFGCSVPAIMATRTLETRRDRLTTMLVIPLMSCGARLPIYGLIIPAFFANRVLVHLGLVKIQQHALLLWTIYLIGVGLAIVCAKLLRATVLRGENTPFVLELPPYRMPTLKGLFIHMWERGRLYIRKAGTIILLLSIVLWAMGNFPRKRTYAQDYNTLTAQAADDYLRAVGQLNPGLSLPNDSPLLTEAIRAEMAMKAEQEKYWPHRPEHTQAEATKNATLAKLMADEHGAVLRQFLKVRDAIAEVRWAFDLAVKERQIEPTLPTGQMNPQYQQLLDRRSAALTAIQTEAPAAYLAAVQFLDDIQSSNNERLHELTNARMAEELGHTVVGRIGRAMEPALRPMGFDWKIGTALVGAMAAKEVFVSQMGIVYATGEADKSSETLRQKLRRNYSPLVGFCVMLFCLITAPCVVTIAVTLRESNSWRWALFQLGGLTLLAYVVTTVVYQVARLLGA